MVWGKTSDREEHRDRSDAFSAPPLRLPRRPPRGSLRVGAVDGRAGAAVPGEPGAGGADDSQGSEEEETTNRVIITRAMLGICYMQVCAVADAPDDEILAVCNRENPSGTTLGWCSVDRSVDGGLGTPGPKQCADDSSRLHFLVAC